jgi:hypothetical protein
MLSVKRVNSSESSGSATDLVSVAPHFAHSNIRFSEWPVPMTVLANRIRVKHLTQRGHSIGERMASILLPPQKDSPTVARRLSDPRHKASGNLPGGGAVRREIPATRTRWGAKAQPRKGTMRNIAD